MSGGHLTPRGVERRLCCGRFRQKRKGNVYYGMGLSGHRRASGGILVHMSEVFRGIYCHEVYGADNNWNGLQFLISVTGHQAASAGNFLCHLDRNRCSGSSDCWYRAVQRVCDGAAHAVRCAAFDRDHRTEGYFRPLTAGGKTSSEKAPGKEGFCDRCHRESSFPGLLYTEVMRFSEPVPGQR